MQCYLSMETYMKKATFNLNNYTQFTMGGLNAKVHSDNTLFVYVIRRHCPDVVLTPKLA